MKVIGNESDFRPSNIADGSVEMPGGVALYPDGVQKFRAPVLAWASERVGRIPVGVMNSMSKLTDRSPDEPIDIVDKVDERVASQNPKKARRVGAVMLALSLPFVYPASQAIEVGATVAGNEIVEAVDNWRQDFVDGLRSLRTGR